MKGLTLSCHNSKLGRLIWNWSIPAIQTCPGSTEACRTACYATQGHYYHAGVRKCHLRNLAATGRASFVSYMVAVIEHSRATVVRIHCAGDFYSAEYIQKWKEIIDALPGVRFYAYTRSWRVPELMPALRDLAKSRNLRLWFSVDKDSEKPPKPRRVGLAYMLSPGEPEERIPPGMHLVFRVARKGVKTRLAGAVVCPPENGKNYKRPVTCATCSLCWREKFNATSRTG